MALSPEEYERAQVARLTGYWVNSDDIGRLVRIGAAALVSGNAGSLFGNDCRRCGAQRRHSCWHARCAYLISPEVMRYAAQVAETPRRSVPHA